MMPSFLQPRFTFPIDSARPKGAPHFEVWAPKLGRRMTLFDQLHVRLFTLLESNPRVSAYCERPAYSDRNDDKQLIDFWVKAGRREVFWIVTAASGPHSPRILIPDQHINLRSIDARHLISHAIWIENWLRILPYLSANATFVSTKLLADIEQTAVTGPTLGDIERDFQPNDIVLIRTAVFMLLHTGRLKADSLRRQPLGPLIRLMGKLR